MGLLFNNWSCNTVICTASWGTSFTCYDLDSVKEMVDRIKVKLESLSIKERTSLKNTINIEQITQISVYVKRLYEQNSIRYNEIQITLKKGDTKYTEFSCGSVLGLPSYNGLWYGIDGGQINNYLNSNGWSYFENGIIANLNVNINLNEKVDNNTGELIIINDFDWKSWAIKEQKKLDSYEKGKELHFLDDITKKFTGNKAVVVGGTLGFMVNGSKYTLKDIINGTLTPAMLGKTFKEGMGKCTGLLYMITGFWSGLSWLTIGGIFFISAALFKGIKSILNDDGLGGVNYPWGNNGLTPSGYLPPSTDNLPFIYATPTNPDSTALNTPWIPSNGGTVGDSGTETGVIKPTTWQEAIEKQALYYGGMKEFYDGESQVGKNWADYYAKGKDVLGFDTKLKEYESLKIENGTQEIIDDLTKRELQKRVEFVETATGIYAGGQRVEGVIDGEGNIVAGGQRTGVKITEDGIYMSGPAEGSGTGSTEVTGQVDLNVPTDAKVQIDADAFIQALANNKVKFDTSGLETALASPTGKVQFNTDPFAQFITDNKLKIDNTGLQEILDSKSIQVQGGVSVNWGTAPTLAIQEGSTVGLDETSLTGITTIAEKIVARDVRETELHADKKAVLENQKTLTKNDVDMMSTKNKIATKEQIITDLKSKAMEQPIEGKNYVERVATEYKNLHSTELRESLALGQAFELPKGILPALQESHIGALLMEIQQSKITENIKSENQPDDDLDLDSNILTNFFFNVNASIKDEVKLLHKDELDLILSLIPPIGSIGKIIDFMNLGGN